jgi:hypothetical protein
VTAKIETEARLMATPICISARSTRRPAPQRFLSSPHGPGDHLRKLLRAPAIWLKNNLAELTVCAATEVFIVAFIFIVSDPVTQLLKVCGFLEDALSTGPVRPW